MYAFYFSTMQELGVISRIQRIRRHEETTIYGAREKKTHSTRRTATRKKRQMPETHRKDQTLRDMTFVQRNEGLKQWVRKKSESGRYL